MTFIVKLRPCGFDALKPFQGLAARERVALKESRDTNWYWITPARLEPFDGSEMSWMGPDAGFAGLYFHRGVGRIKSVLVFQGQRGRGYGELAVAALENIAANAGCSAVEAFAWNRAFYERRGYTCTATNAHGAFRMIKRL